MPSEKNLEEAQRWLAYHFGHLAEAQDEAPSLAALFDAIEAECRADERRQAADLCAAHAIVLGNDARDNERRAAYRECEESIRALGKPAPLPDPEADTP